MRKWFFVLSFVLCLQVGVDRLGAEEVVEVERRFVAFTFDDGPTTYTEFLLDALLERGVKATFYVIGRNVLKHPDLAQRMVDEGHELGSHSFSHPNFHTLSREETLQQFMLASLAIRNIVGEIPKTYRPPHGRHNDYIIDAAKAFGMTIVYWDVNSQDWPDADIDTVKINILNEVAHGSIILSHDSLAAGVVGTLQAIDELLEQGYELVTVSELFIHLGYKVLPGQAYGSNGGYYSFD